jgi:hypothetical protein
MKHGVPQNLIVVGTLLFIIYINDFPPTISTSSEPIIFADEISLIISRKKKDDFCTMSIIVLSHMNKWFTANKLDLNLDKIKTIKFVTNHYSML